MKAYSAPFSCAYATMREISVSWQSLKSRARAAIPGFFFAITAKISVSWLRARARTMACSRPPPPTIRIVMDMYSCPLNKNGLRFQDLADVNEREERNSVLPEHRSGALVPVHDGDYPVCPGTGGPKGF